MHGSNLMNPTWKMLWLPTRDALRHLRCGLYAAFMPHPCSPLTAVDGCCWTQIGRKFTKTLQVLVDLRPICD
ncbi:hypothetical protein FHX76_003164 [Lysinibacter cavernae]|uniref:Uncharacterized protein n=1 Tax=Lysinibacter cavernae TaxID=1640652 RepID=A0A7X5R3Z7_9MICO|nr:hypothetical protein [Lysinibacter cavernae]